jgi:manganese oxidase
MEMALPDNTLPMMTGQGPYGAMEMGGMFTTVKVRRGLARNDYKDPGWYRQPAGTQAYEWTGELPKTERAAESGKAAAGTGEPVLNIRKGNKHDGH